MAANVALAALVGIGLRVAWLEGKPFWRDEAWLAWVVALRPSDRAGVWHVIPVGFLAAVRVIAALVPDVRPEIAYRIIPLAAGIGCLALLPLLAKRLGASSGAVLCTAWLAAGMPAMVYYSRELKPYALDLLWSTLLCIVAIGLVERRTEARGSARLWLALFTLAELGPWMSHGAVFPTASALAWIGWRRLRGGAWCEALPAVIGAAALFGATLAAAYALHLRHQIAHPLLPLMWDDALQPGGLPPALAAARPFVDVFRVPLPYLFPSLWPVAAVLAMVGLAALPASGREAVLWSWLGSAAPAAVCAAGRVYVVAHGRFLLFLAPALIVCVAAGLARSSATALGRYRRAGAGLAVALSATFALAWGVRAVQARLRSDAVRPRPFVFDVIQDVDPLVGWLEARRVPPTNVLVGRHAADPFRFYSRGRLNGARLMSFRGHAYGFEFAGWLADHPDGWLLLVEEEAGNYARALKAASFRIAPMAFARGTVLWHVTREASPPRIRRDSRAGAGAATGSGT